jgi:hypothetical protein
VSESVRRLGALVMRRRGALAVVFILLTVLFAGLYRVADGVEKHSYSSGAIPPTTVELTTGHTYEISLPGGREGLKRAGIPASAAQCTWSQGNQIQQPLTVTAISADLRPTHAIATFTSPVSGEVHVDCADFGAVYIDDADNAGTDYAGLFLLLTAGCLLLGVALGLSALYARAGSGGAAGDEDEVQALVDVGGRNGEIRGANGDDVPH